MSYANRPLNRQDYKTLTLAALGGALEFYDFIIFVFFAAVVGELFFPADIPEWLRQVQTFGIFAAGYLARPLGGIIMAHFGDLVGRKKMFTLSILLMALPTLAIGLLPTYSSVGIIAPLLLLLMRILQGAAIGGEVPGAWVFVAEHVPEKRIGIACGTLTAGLTVGILLGSVVATLINTSLTPQGIHDGGWRIPFLLGGVFGLIAMYLRRWLQETPIFLEMQQRKALAQELPVKAVALKHQKAVVISMLLTWLLSAGVVVVILMSPVWLQKHYGFAPAITLQANSIATIMLCIGCLLAGLAADRFGELAALAVTDVSRRRSDQTRDIVLLAVFAHVDADQAPVLVEQPLRDLLGQQGLAHARGTHEEEDADRAVFVLESGARAADRAGDPLHSLLLSHDAACEVVVEHLQARHLAARYPFGGNTRDRGDNLLDVFRSDLYGIGLQ